LLYQANPIAEETKASSKGLPPAYGEVGQKPRNKRLIPTSPEAGEKPSPGGDVIPFV